MNSLAVERVSFERDDVPIFENVDFTLSSGEIMQFAGHNGSGKTTLMRVIAGLITPSAGSVCWNELDVRDHQFRSSLLFLGHQIGIKATMTPLENLRWYFGLNGRKAEESHQALNADMYVEALDKVGLYNYRDAPCYQLSAGQHRRAALARLFLSEAPIWILDEPFTAIDKQGVSKLEQRIDAHAASGGMVILTTHQAWRSENSRLLDLEAFKPSMERLDA